MSDLQSIFSQKLKSLCETRPSISKVAEDLSINRQQFARYVNGTSIPRQDIIDRLATYFSVPVSFFFSEADAGPKAGAGTAGDNIGLQALFDLLSLAPFKTVTPDDLEPGFYGQIKRSFTKDGQILRSLVYVTYVDGVARYRNALNNPFQSQRTRREKNFAYNGVFVKIDGNLMMADVNGLNGDLTIHIFRRSYQYDPSIKVGVHSYMSSGINEGVRSALILWRKLREDESVLAYARSTGWVDEADISPIEREILQGMAFENPGIIGI